MKEEDLKKFIQNALIEDIGDGDHTSLASIPSDAISQAHLIVKDNGIIAGIELAKMIFNEVDSSLKIEQTLKDGDKVLRTEDEVKARAEETGETLEEIKARLKPKKSNVSADMFDTANTYDDKVALVRLLVADDAGRVANVLKKMIRPA